MGEHKQYAIGQHPNPTRMNILRGMKESITKLGQWHYVNKKTKWKLELMRTSLCCLGKSKQQRARERHVNWILFFIYSKNRSVPSEPLMEELSHWKTFPPPPTWGLGGKRSDLRLILSLGWGWNSYSNRCGKRLQPNTKQKKRVRSLLYIIIIEGLNPIRA